MGLPTIGYTVGTKRIIKHEGGAGVIECLSCGKKRKVYRNKINKDMRAPCRCKLPELRKKHLIGDIINGRRVIEESKGGKSMVLECLKCGTKARTNSLINGCKCSNRKYNIGDRVGQFILKQKLSRNVYTLECVNCGSVHVGIVATVVNRGCKCTTSKHIHTFMHLGIRQWKDILGIKRKVLEYKMYTKKMTLEEAVLSLIK